MRAPVSYERPPFGQFGSIAQIGERLVCHLCGRDYLNLQTHIQGAHGWRVAEYKKMFGLRRRTALWAHSLRIKTSEQMIRKRADGRLRTHPQTREWMKYIQTLPRDRRLETVLRAKEYGRQLAAKYPPRRKYSDQVVRIAQDLQIDFGLGASAIAAVLLIPPSTIHEWLVSA